MGIHMVSCTFVGLAIGYFLEEWLCGLGWCAKPWVMIFWLVAGIAAGFKNMYEESQKLQKAERDGQSGHGSGRDDRQDDGRNSQ